MLISFAQASRTSQSSSATKTFRRYHQMIYCSSICVGIYHIVETIIWYMAFLQEIRVYHKIFSLLLPPPTPLSLPSLPLSLFLPLSYPPLPLSPFPSLPPSFFTHLSPSLPLPFSFSFHFYLSLPLQHRPILIDLLSRGTISKHQCVDLFNSTTRERRFFSVCSCREGVWG